MNTTLTKKSTVIPLALLCCLLWGSAFPCIKIGYRLTGIASDDSASQLLFAGMRFLLAGVLAVLIGSFTSRRFLFPSAAAAFRAIKLSLFQTISQYTFFYLGLARTTGVKSSIITSSNVFFSVLTASLIFRSEKLTLRKAAGCLLGFSGVLLINLSGGGGLSGGFTLTGEGFILFSAMSYAVSSGLMKKYSQKDDPVMLSGYQFIFGGAVMIAVGLALGGNVPRLTFSGAAMLAYLAFVSAAAFSLWSILLKYNPVSEVSVFGFMNPVFGVILSASLLSESSSAPLMCILLALVLVAAGIVIVNRADKAPPKRDIQSSSQEQKK